MGKHYSRAIHNNVTIKTLALITYIYIYPSIYCVYAVGAEPGRHPWAGVPAGEPQPRGESERVGGPQEPGVPGPRQQAGGAAVGGHRQRPAAPQGDRLHRDTEAAHWYKTPHTRACTHAHTHTCTHARTHAGTHTPLSWWLIIHSSPHMQSIPVNCISRLYFSFISLCCAFFLSFFFFFCLLM